MSGPELRALLHAAARDAAARHDLVEDRHRAVLLAEADDGLEEARLGRNDAHVADDRLHDDRGDLLAALGEERLERLDVVVGRRDRRASRSARARPPSRGRRTWRARACLHQEEVGVAVVAALELDDASRPVNPRATRSAAMHASVPLDTARTISIDG